MKSKNVKRLMDMYENCPICGSNKIEIEGNKLISGIVINSNTYALYNWSSASINITYVPFVLSKANCLALPGPILYGVLSSIIFKSFLKISISFL